MTDSKKPPETQPKQPAKNSIQIEEWYKLVHKVLQTQFKHCWRPYKNRRGINYMDLFQEGVLGLISAINGWEEEHDSGAAFTTYAWRCIYTTVANYADQNMTPITTSRWRSVQDGSEKLIAQHLLATNCRLFTEMGAAWRGNYSSPNSSFSEQLPDPRSHQHINRLERQDTIQEAMRRMRKEFGDKDVDMLVEYYGGATYEQLGRKLGTSYETIRKRINKLRIAAFGILSDMEDQLYDNYIG
jgi:RNA polymerase sigma factor (sigma-70 family)